MPEKARIIALAFSPDSTQFAAMSRTGELHVWSLDSGAMRRAVTADPGPVAFSANGRWIAVGNRSIRVLDAGSLRPLTQLDIGGDIRSIEFRAEDTLIAARRLSAGSLRGVVELHRWRPADMLAESCRRMPIAAAESQWKQLLPEERLPSPCQ
jgi:WD40 repeat protein